MEILLKRNKQNTSSLPSSLSPGEPLWFKDQLYIGSVGTDLGGSYTSGYPVPITGGGGSGSSTLSGLTDTVITSPTSGEILSYDSENAVWVNSAAPSSLPSQSGNSGKYLTTNGSSASWATINIPSAPGTLNTTAVTAQSTSASESLSGNISLHKVAKTGTYSDLIGTPTIPTVNNATLTIQKNGTNVATFTANASSNVTANISIRELPAVTSSDNNKVLMVVNGAWAAQTVDIQSYYTGSSSPQSTLGNNGDIYLQVN